MLCVQEMHDFVSRAKKEEITSQKNALRCDEVWIRRQAGKGGKVREAVLSENEEDKDKECCVCRKCTILLVVQKRTVLTLGFYSMFALNALQMHALQLYL